MEQYEPKQNQNVQGQEELTQMIQDGVHPETVKDRLKLAGDKFIGNVPLGVDASTKTMRKVIGGGAELLGVFKFGIFGGLLALLGLPITYIGVYPQFQWKTVAIGAAMLGTGIWALREARHAWRNFRTISKA